MFRVTELKSSNELMNDSSNENAVELISRYVPLDFGAICELDNLLAVHLKTNRVKTCFSNEATPSMHTVKVLRPFKKEVSNWRAMLRLFNEDTGSIITISLKSFSKNRVKLNLR